MSASSPSAEPGRQQPHPFTPDLPGEPVQHPPERRDLTAQHVPVPPARRARVPSRDRSPRPRRAPSPPARPPPPAPHRGRRPGTARCSRAARAGSGRRCSTGLTIIASSPARAAARTSCSRLGLARGVRVGQRRGAGRLLGHQAAGVDDRRAAARVDDAGHAGGDGGGEDRCGCRRRCCGGSGRRRSRPSPARCRTPSQPARGPLHALDVVEVGHDDLDARRQHAGRAGRVAQHDADVGTPPDQQVDERTTEVAGTSGDQQHRAIVAAAGRAAPPPTGSRLDRSSRRSRVVYRSPSGRTSTSVAVSGGASRSSPRHARSPRRCSAVRSRRCMLPC